MILGGKPAGAAPPGDPLRPHEVAALTERVSRYRRLLAGSADVETAGLVDDMQAALDALRRLEQSTRPAAQSHAAEYRRLIIEIDTEIVAALQNRKEPR